MIQKRLDGTYIAERENGQRRHFQQKRQAERWLSKGKVLSPQADVDTLLSHQQIADMMGVSKERVKQIENRALYKLRALLLKIPEVTEWVQQ
jgi:DNA-directed RNA polymerase sigma subunit (sigma70/sigma32)